MIDDFYSLRPPQEVVGVYPPDREALFDLVRSEITDENLAAIAACDYGDRTDEHLAALKEIRDGANRGEPIEWVPNEVLGLFRWSEYSDERTQMDQTAFHLTRAFCCCALLRYPDVNENRTPFSNESVAPLIESCAVLGEPYLTGLASYFTWSLQTMDIWDDDYLFHAFGLMIVLTELQNADSPLLERCGQWLIRANAHILPWHFHSRLYTSEMAKAWLENGGVNSGNENINADEATGSFLKIEFATIRDKFWRRLCRSAGERLQPGSQARALLQTV